MKLFINKIHVKKIQCMKENLLRTKSLNKVMQKERKKKQANWKNPIPSYVAQCQNS